MAHTLTDPREFDPNFFDGILTLRNLFAQPNRLRVYPRQIVVLEGRGRNRLSFVHGMPDVTTLTSAMTIQHKRMRRGILERNDVPVPKGAAFSMARGLKQAKAFAQRLGFPVVIKPSRGDAGFYNFTDLGNQRELDWAIAKMKVPTYERPGVFHSGYTPMELGAPRRESGRTIVPGGYRILVEKQVAGQLVRFLVYEGAVISAVRCEGSPSDGTLRSSSDVLAQVHPLILKTVKRAFHSFPHTGIAAIDIVTSNVSDPNNNGDAQVVDYWERPFLWVQARDSLDLALDLSERITSGYMSSHGLNLDAVPSEARVHMRAHSLPSARLSQSSLSEIATDAGVKYSVSGYSDLEGTIEGTLEGGSLELAALIDAISNGAYHSIPAGLIEVERV